MPVALVIVLVALGLLIGWRSTTLLNAAFCPSWQWGFHSLLLLPFKTLCYSQVSTPGQANAECDCGVRLRSVTAECDWFCAILAFGRSGPALPIRPHHSRAPRKER